MVSDGDACDGERAANRDLMHRNSTRPTSPRPRVQSGLSGTFRPSARRGRQVDDQLEFGRLQDSNLGSAALIALFLLHARKAAIGHIASIRGNAALRSLSGRSGHCLSHLYGNRVMSTRPIGIALRGTQAVQLSATDCELPAQAAGPFTWTLSLCPVAGICYFTRNICSSPPNCGVGMF